MIPRRQSVLLPAVLLFAAALPLLAIPQIWPDVADHINFGNPVWADLDVDGDLDLFVVNHWFSAGVWRNDGAWRFTEVTPWAFSRDDDRHGVAAGDYDRDGDPDLFLAMGAGGGDYLGRKQDQLWRNDRAWAFANVTEAAGVQNAWGRGRSPRWLDLDRDGDLDLLVLNYYTPHVLYENLGNGAFRDVSEASGIATVRDDLWTGTVGDFDGDLWPDLFLTGDGPDTLLRNGRDGTFSDASAEAGLGALPLGRGVAAFDADNDGDLDVFVARDAPDKNKNLTVTATRIALSDTLLNIEHGLDIRTTGGSLTLDLTVDNERMPDRVRVGPAGANPVSIPFTVSAADAAAVGKPSYSYGTLGWFLWREPGDPGLWHLRWDGDQPDVARYFFAVLTSDGEFGEPSTVWWTPAPAPSVTDTLYRNMGNGTFTDASAAAGVAGPPEWTSRGVAAGDVNNDGWLDLYVVNTGNRTVGKPPNHLWINRRNFTFLDRAAVAGVQALVRGLGEGAALADFDRSGFLDLFTVQGRDEPVPGAGPHLLYRNPGSTARWIAIRLAGTGSPTDGYGAWVSVRTGALRQHRYTGSGGAGGGDFFSQQSPGIVHFGLGAYSQADQVEVRWPSGRTGTYGPLAPNRFYVITEGAGIREGI